MLICQHRSGSIVSRSDSGNIARGNQMVDSMQVLPAEWSHKGASQPQCGVISKPE